MIAYSLFTTDNQLTLIITTNSIGINASCLLQRDQAELSSTDERLRDAEGDEERVSAM